MSRKVILAFLLIFSFAAIASAGTLSVGDEIYLTATAYWPNVGGGPFYIHNQNGDMFESFCVEYQEGFDNTMWVADISKDAYKGGEAVSDPISEESQVLAYGWFTNQLGVPKSTELAAKVQIALWLLEDEVVPGKTIDPDLQTWIDDHMMDEEFVQMAVNSVMVMNPVSMEGADAGGEYARQSQVFFVPEPALITLLGLGFLGVALARKKFNS